jgi:3-hydroxyisobutyrate dehydrogenase
MHVAVIGTGLLGTAVAERLQAARHRVIVYNRTAAKAEPLRALGMTVADSPAHAIRTADCTLLFLADAAAIQSLVLNADTRSALPGRTMVQMGTISPEDSRVCLKAVTASGGDYLEAPVLGSMAEARAGSLLVMVGGTDAQFQQWSPLLRSLSKELRLVGPVGQAATLKLALNQLIAAETAGFALSLALIRHAAVPVELFMSILKQSALFAPTFEKKLPRMQSREYHDPNFSTRHLLKDVDLFLSVAQHHGVRTTGLEGIRGLLTDAIAHGHADVDYSALYEEVSPG